MPPRVSLTMIVRDEAGKLARCLASVADLVDEMVVVDTGSADATRAVAASAGARVVDHTWSESFAEARNASLDHARGAWAFWLDADEWLDDENRARLGALLQGLDDRAVYFMEQLSPLHGPGGGVLSVSQPRLFRTGPSLRWRFRVHEQILPACLERGDRPCATAVVIAHSGYATAVVTRGKEERNRRILEVERAANPDDPWLLLQLARLDLEHRFEDAEALLLRARQQTRPADPLRRQLHALLARGYRLQGASAQAGAVLASGLDEAPNDTNLLVEAGAFAFEQGRLDEAGRIYRALLSAPPDPGEFLGAIDLSWRGWQARHNLAVVLHRQSRAAEAEAEWQAALAEKPDAPLAWLGLAELYLGQSRWDELARALAMAERCVPGSAGMNLDDVRLMQARVHLARAEYGQARTLLDDLIARRPEAVIPRLLRVRADLFEEEYDAAEAGLRDVLRIDPENTEARRSLLALEKALGDAEEESEGTRS